LAVNNVVLFAVGVLQKKSFIDAYKVGPVLQCDYEIKQREGQCIAVLLTAPCERALMSDKIVRMQFKTVSPSYSPKIAHCERSARLLSGTRVAAIASKDGDAAAL
jgi:ethanolamine utilization microcompartment shell protein EutL